MPVERESPDYTAAHLRALIESTRDMIWSVDLSYRLVTFNKALSDEFKYNHGIKAKAGMGPGDLFTPDRAALWPPLYERALKEGRFQTEYGMADGRYLELELNPIVESGKNTGVWVLSKDITERKAARQSLVSVIEALRATEERYHTAFETCTDSITISRMSDGMILDANKAFLDFFGFSREEIAGRTAPELGMWVEPRERDILLETVRREGKCRNLEVHTRLKSGEITWTLLSATTIELDGTTCLLSVGRDITERKRAEMALRETNDLMQLFVEHAPVSIAMFDREMRYLAASRQHQAGLGLAAREIIGHSHYEFFPNLQEHFKEAHRRAMAGEVVSGEDRCPKGLLGVEIWGRWSVHPWYTGAGAVGGIVLFTLRISPSANGPRKSWPSIRGSWRQRWPA